MKILVHVFLSLIFCVSCVPGKVSITENSIKPGYDLKNGEVFFEGFEIESLLNISTCLRQFQMVLKGSFHGEIWALKFLDSWGKLPPGIISNNTVSFGDFDQCIRIKEDIDGELIQGQYCLTKIPIVKFISKDPISIGLCIPSSCNVVEIQDQLLESLEIFLDTSTNGTGFFDQRLCTEEQHVVLKTMDIACISILGIITLLIILSTAYEFVTEHMIAPRSELLVAFSLLQNCSELFATKNPVSPNYIRCLCGLWSLSILGIIFDGSYDGVFKWDLDTYTLVSFRTRFYVDNFLLLSAFSITSDVFTEMTMKGSLNTPKLYLNQYLRLSTVFGFVILFVATVFKFIGNGPVWNMEIEVFEPCQKYWWSAITHMQQYVNPEDMCLEHSWYLSVNMQLTVISLIILYPLYKWQFNFIWILPVFVALCITGLYFIQSADSASIESTEIEDLQFAAIYGALPWLIGIMLGYVMFSIRASFFTISKHVIRLGWISVFLIMAASLYFTFEYKRTSDDSNKVETILIKLFSRFLWALCVCWIVFACTRGYGGIVNKFLCLSFWQPLSKLCTTMFILHYIVHVYAKATTRSSVFVTEYQKVQYFWGNFGATLILSIICILCFEYPALNLESLFWRQIEKCFRRQTYNVQTPTRSQSGSDDNNEV